MGRHTEDKRRRLDRWDGTSTAEGALAASNHLIGWLVHGKTPWVRRVNDAISMLAIPWKALEFFRSRYPGFEYIQIVRGKGVHILPIWLEARWVLVSDVVRYLGVRHDMVLDWIHDGILQVENRTLRYGRRCVPIEQVLELEYRLRVKDLVGWPHMGWDKVEAWIQLGSQAIEMAAARKASEQNERCYRERKRR